VHILGYSTAVLVNLAREQAFFVAALDASLVAATLGNLFADGANSTDNRVFFGSILGLKVVG
jgi:hypothetical protein